MRVQTHTLTIHTQGNNDIIDLTIKVQDYLSASEFHEGTALIFAAGSTAGITTIEYEPGLVETDLKELFEKIAPYGRNYAHNATWGDDNGAAHLRAALLGSSLVVPFSERRLLTGTWQQIVCIDFDTRPRSRKIVVQLQGQ